MGCQACGSAPNPDGSPRGCGSKGSCGTGSCNRLSTYDWLSHLGLDDSRPTHYVEVSFKEGCSKGFYRLQPGFQVYTGDNVAVETESGYDIGRVTLSGELVRLQMRKKKVQEKHVHHDVLRIANLRDLERMLEARGKEQEALVKTRAIVRTAEVDMKVSDVEFQGDGRKMTVYYVSEKRVDFRELIRQLAHAFKTKIEMRQIGARQEAARLGGIGSCGRELCCSTWLTDFQSVNTSAARYQNIAINQTKLSGQCGRLKCCLNYELDTYMEALEAFPKKADKLKTEAGLGILIKTDIFKQLMYYTYKENRGALFPIPVKEIHRILKMLQEGKMVSDLQSFQIVEETIDQPTYDDVIGAVELPNEKKRTKKRKSRKGGKADSPVAPTGRTASPSRTAATSRTATLGKGKPAATTSGKSAKPTELKATDPKAANLQANTGGQAPTAKPANKNRRRKKSQGATAGESRPNQVAPPANNEQQGVAKSNNRRRNRNQRKSSGGSATKTDGGN